MIKVGLIGYGKAGQAVAQVLHQQPDVSLCWIARRNGTSGELCRDLPVPILNIETTPIDAWLDQNPVDALIDFSSPAVLRFYGETLRQRHLTLISAISAYSDADIAYIRSLGQDCRVMHSPNITLGINFLILAARLLRDIAPNADIAVLEEHFREKPEISGTARRIANHLDLPEDRITSLRLGGIVGHHEVVFGFPYQTVRISHDSIRREAFGTGAVYALRELIRQPRHGFFSFEQLLMARLQEQLQRETAPAATQATTP